jgi:ABC-type Fe3+-hydroxamate transport system substrate-binding protein
MSIKIILIIITVVTMLGISACGDKQSNQSTVTDDYRYSSYTYDDNAPQYYMAGSAAASETGYYYIDGAPVLIHKIRCSRKQYIYYVYVLQSIKLAIILNFII